MRRLMLVLMFVFFLGALQTVIPDSPVSARHYPWHCCTCGMCDSGCYCKGQTIYCTCNVTDDEGIHPGHHEDEVTIDIRGMNERRAFMIAQMNLDERLQTMITRGRSNRHFALKVLEGYENGLKIWCPTLRSPCTSYPERRPGGGRR